MNRALRHLYPALVAMTGLTATACSEQGEGERCDYFRSGNTASGEGRDCKDGLECVPASQLLLNDDTDRCCPPVGEPTSDERCRRRSSGSSGVGTGGTAAGGAAGSTGAAVAGAAASAGSSARQGGAAGKQSAPGGSAGG